MGPCPIFGLEDVADIPRLKNNGYENAIFVGVIALPSVATRSAVGGVPACMGDLRAPGGERFEAHRQGGILLGTGWAIVLKRFLREQW